MTDDSRFSGDLILNQTVSDDSWQPSAIAQINGTDAVDYLTQFAALNSPGTLEPNADWNLLMDNPLYNVLEESYPLWAGGATFYPGDTFSYTFENGSTFGDQWSAVYFGPPETGPLETGGDFYNFFVLGFYPASYNDSAASNNISTIAVTSNETVTAPTNFTEFTNAFPRPDIAQGNLTVDGYMTGYFIRDASLAVLSLPTFWAEDYAIDEFTTTVQQFLNQSKAAGMEKVLIDLQQNDGGDTLLAYSVFKQFFPSIQPYGGSVMRAQPMADMMGGLITSFWTGADPSILEYVASDEWIATSKLDEAGQNFSSWAELYGPFFDGVENFTAVERFNTTNYAFDYSSLGFEEPPSVLLSPYSGDAPYTAENIIMVSTSPMQDLRPHADMCL